MRCNMKKTFAKFLGILLSVVLACSVAPMFASAASAPYVLNSFDTQADVDRVTDGGGPTTIGISLDTTDSLNRQGNSLFVTMPTEGLISHGTSAYININVGAVDASQYDYIEFVYKNHQDASDVVLYVYPYDGTTLIHDNYPVDFDSTIGKWQRQQLAITENLKPKFTHLTTIIGAVYNKSGFYNKLDTHYDNYVLLKQDYVDARTEKEQELEQLIDSVAIPTITTYSSLEQDLSLIHI